jgi:Family of unknown function (DUF6701)/PA14 domain/Concanavalin A-like lectin/glucanases superfamily/Bacterial Ig-like domain
MKVLRRKLTMLRIAGCTVALLCAGALTTAQAQIALRAAASAGIATLGAGGIAYGGNGAAASRNSCGSISPTLPAGAASGDLLIMAVTSASSPALSAAGWTQLFNVNPAGNLTSAIFWRVATGGDPNTLTQSGSCNTLIAQIASFSGVDTSNPFFTSPLGAANYSYQNANTVTSGTQSTSVANAMVVFTAHSSDNDSFGALGGYTQGFNSNTTTGSDAAVGLYYALQASTGSYGPYTVTNNRGADANTGVVFALRPAGGAGLTISVPAGTVADDVMVASIAVRDYTAAPVAPAGWTLVRDTQQTTGNSSRLATYYRVAGGAEPASYSWTFSGTGFSGAAGGIASFSGVDTTTPVDAEGGNTTPNSYSHTANAIVTTVADTMLVGSFEYPSVTNGWDSVPAGWSEALAENSQTPPNNAGIALEMSYGAQAATGSTGAKTATANSTGNNSDPGAAHLLALRPKAGGVTLDSASVVCGSLTQVEVLFSAAVTAASAQTASNYALSGGASVTGAVLGSDSRIVTLTVSGLSSGAGYTLTVNNIVAQAGGTIAANSQTTFYSEGGYLSGLLGTYYDQNGTQRAYFTGNTVVQTDGPVNFDWGNGAPVAGIGADDFSVAWDGYVTPLQTGSYTFRTTSDDGVRLYVNGALVIDDWTDHASTNDDSAAIALTAGQRYTIRMEYYERAGQAVAQLLWSGPGTGGFQAIPRSSLSHFCGLPQPAAFYKMDELAWNGTAGEVADSSGNGLNGTAVGGAVPTLAKVCNGAQLNGSTQYVQVGGLSGLLNSTASLAFWIKTTQTGNDTGWQAPGVTGVEQSGGADDIFWGWLDASGHIGVSVGNDYTTKSTVAINDGTWRHVVLTRDQAAGTYKIYIDGALNASGSIATGVIGTAFSSIGRIEDTGGTPEYLNGQLDEVRVYSGVLTDAQVVSIMNETRPCTNLVDHYAISYPFGASGVTCDASDVQITAHDAGHAAIAPSAGTVLNITTSTGAGTWQPGLVAGLGGWVPSGANNGQASYVWAGGETTFTVRLRQNTPATINVNLLDSGSRPESAGEDPSISFADTALRVTADGASAATIGTQISGKPSNTGFGAQTLYLQAIRTDTSTGSCVGLIQGQTATVQMAGARVSPTGGASALSVRDGGGTMQAVGTGAGAPGAYTNVSLAFDAQSKAPLVVSYPDAGSVALYAQYALPSPPAGTYVSGSSNAFVVRPFGLRVSGVTTAASPSPSSPVFAKAGANFNATLTAVAWKAGDDANADGVPDSDAQIASNAATPNFDATATLSHTLNAPSGGNAGTLGGSTSFSGFSAGAKTQAVSWSEVGFIDLHAKTTNYLGSGQDVGNSSAGLTGVGRFIPDHFALSGGTLTNRAAAACAPASSFSYLGEGMRLQFTLTAQSTANATTQNYTTASGFAKLPTLPSGMGFGAVNGTTNLTSRLDLGISSALGWSAGAASVDYTLAVDRASPDNPDGPFGAAKIGVAPSDGDGVGLAAAAYDMDVDNNSANDHQQVGAGTQLLFGRLLLRNALGARKSALPIPITVQAWQGTAFIANALDSCTRLPRSAIVLGGYQGALAPGGGNCKTYVQQSPVAFSAGAGTLTLAAPAGGAGGSVLLTPNLTPTAAGNYCASAAGGETPASAAGMDYLLGRWNDMLDPDANLSTAYDDNPSARAAFGLYGSQPDRLIYHRENY